ncbi:MAG: hypothetical protein EPN64_18935 [Burkholderiaceae bacterium]|nr:MAG: hypothetical protein EPN64_18935 [Burkholderiaceae bacterium]
MHDYTDPATTLRLLDDLQPLGFSDEAFALLHHFPVPERIASHRRYCEALWEEGARFRTQNNPLVQRRLEMVLAMYKAGDFKSSVPAVFEHLARATVLEVPHNRRPLSEQGA